MGLARARTVALIGVQAFAVDVEAHVGVGLPGMHVVGSADSGIAQSKDRVRTAVANSHLPWPKTKVVVSLSPATLPKSGAHFDLPIAMAILAAGLGMATVPAGPGEEIAQRLNSTMFLGELGLDGGVKEVPGVIPALTAARDAGWETAVIPPGNAGQAHLVPELCVLVAPSVRAAFAWLRGEEELYPAARWASASGDSCDGASAGLGTGTGATQACMSDIAGQAETKKALEVAAAGGHHVFMVGPPGSGKSMLAQRMPTILPALEPAQQVEATAVHALSGKPGDVVRLAPFVAPHTTVTRAGLLGGGSSIPRPGAVSLAHHGVLFLDEVSEISAAVLDAMRAPLEDGVVRLIRHRHEVSYPARFQLIMAANPCRCAAEEPSACRCSSRERQGYLNNISGPLRDRLDMIVHVGSAEARIESAGEETSAVIAQRVGQARERAAWRWKKAGLDISLNSGVPARTLRRDFPAEESAMALLQAYLAQGELSQRGVDRTLKLAWTLADLEDQPRPDAGHVAAAMDCRGAEVIERLAA